MTLFTLASSPAGLVFRVSFFCFEGRRERQTPILSALSPPRTGLARNHIALVLLHPSAKPRALCAGARAVVSRHRPGPGEARKGEVQRRNAGGGVMSKKNIKKKKELVPMGRPRRPDGTCASTPRFLSPRRRRYELFSSSFSNLLPPPGKTSTLGATRLLGRTRSALLFAPPSSSSPPFMIISLHLEKQKKNEKNSEPPSPSTASRSSASSGAR